MCFYWLSGLVIFEAINKIFVNLCYVCMLFSADDRWPTSRLRKRGEMQSSKTAEGHIFSIYFLSLKHPAITQNIVRFIERKTRNVQV